MSLLPWLLLLNTEVFALGFQPVHRAIVRKFQSRLRVAESNDDESLVGRTYRVVGMEYRDGYYANLKVYSEPGDPYEEVVSHLKHGNEIVSTGFKNFAGQTWVQHLVDESKQGLYKGDEPKEPYYAWSYQDFGGRRWLQCMDVTSVSALETTGAPDAAEMLDAKIPEGYDSNNLFAKIIRGEVNSYRVFETEHALAILDAFPAAPYHCLLLPKAPSLDMGDLGPDAAAGFLRELPRLVSAVKAASGAPAVKIVSNAGAAAGQEVFHTHVHVLPRFPGEGEELVSALEMISSEEGFAAVAALKASYPHLQ